MENKEKQINDENNEEHIQEQKKNVQSGQLQTWGRGSHGQLGQEEQKFPDDNCALPYKIKTLKSIVHVSCGGGQQGCTSAVTLNGELYTFGNNYKKRIGHDINNNIKTPTKVNFNKQINKNVFITKTVCGFEHMLILDIEGNIQSCGSNNCGNLGRSDDKQINKINLSYKIIDIDCENNQNAIISIDNELFTWGNNSVGQLGNGTKEHSSNLKLILNNIRSSQLGSLQMGAIDKDNNLFMWGYGGHGNLGLGNRKSYKTPMKLDIGSVKSIACTRGQDGCKGGLIYPDKNKNFSTGQEGPHTLILLNNGCMQSCGTAHKGLLGNLGSKTGAFGEDQDELSLQLIGSNIKNGTKCPPTSKYSLWPPPYNLPKIIGVVSAHIHCCCLTETGILQAWGCGSNDGRCGVERFINMHGNNKPLTIDRMKCYMMNPHMVGVCDKKQWEKESLENVHIIQVASGRNHMACIGFNKIKKLI